MTKHVADRVTSGLAIMMGKPEIKGARIPDKLILRRPGVGDSEIQILFDCPRLRVDEIRTV